MIKTPPNTTANPKRTPANRKVLFSGKPPHTPSTFITNKPLRKIYCRSTQKGCRCMICANLTNKDSNCEIVWLFLGVKPWRLISRLCYVRSPLHDWLQVRFLAVFQWILKISRHSLLSLLSKILILPELIISLYKNYMATQL